MAQQIGTDLNEYELGSSDGNHYLQQNKDVAESMIRKVDHSVRDSTGMSLLHILTFASIGASIALYASGKKNLGIFIGLWPPTFQALKSVADAQDKKQ